MVNLHTHSTFCDGKNTPEEIVIKAMEKGFSAIGFSGHAYTGFDVRYCMRDTEGYIAEINRLKQVYGGDIEIYLGMEEDAFAETDRSRLDYIIGSSHYFCVDGRYYPIDSSYDYFKKCLEVFKYDCVSLAETYYSSFVKYIKSRKPDIIGHFDLITKFDELDVSLFLENGEYKKIAENYALQAAEAGCIFEVNTGAISRGMRKTPYPSKELLYALKKQDAGLILSSDSHVTDTLDFGFEEATAYLRDIGFKHLYTLSRSEFVKYEI